jgi:hypothetical protein
LFGFDNIKHAQFDAYRTSPNFAKLLVCRGQTTRRRPDDSIVFFRHSYKETVGSTQNRISTEGL